MSLFKKLFSLFNGGKKCEEKKETKFFFQQEVRVVSGFYRGLAGKIEKECLGKYFVNNNNFMFWAEENELEKVEDGNSD